MSHVEGEHPESAGCIRVGFSESPDAATAAAEFYQAVWQPGLEIAVFFCSPDYDLPALESALACHFGDAPVVGCTTAGEITPAGYRQGTLTGFSLAAPEFRVSIQVLDGLQSFELKKGYDAARAGVESLRRRGQDANGDNAFGFLLIDGCCFREEAVAHSLHAALQDITLFGGSAGDGIVLRQNPRVYHGGRFQGDRAVFALVSTTRPFRIIKSENYLPSEKRMVITEAEPETRRVLEINGELATVEYAELIGIAPEDLNAEVFAANPVGLRLGEEYYMRAIGWHEPEGALQFACAIEEGVVLSMARRGDYLGVLRDALERARTCVGEPELLIAFDCVLRLYETHESGIGPEVSELMRRHKAIGFNTYGEQYNAQHVNHTLTAVAIGPSSGASSG